MAAQPQPRAATVAEPPRVMDVALGPNHTLRGAVVDPQGIPVPATQVVLLNGHRQIGVTETDEQGRFVFSEITGAVYGVAAAGAVKVCRLWAPHTAPPAANQDLLVVADGQAVRGLNPFNDRAGRIYTWMSEHPLLTYSLIAAAITVPIVLLAKDSASK